MVTLGGNGVGVSQTNMLLDAPLVSYPWMCLDNGGPESLSHNPKIQNRFLTIGKSRSSEPSCEAYLSETKVYFS